ncbi:MAG: hypothetical protein V3V14_00375 [Saprospiraceae bacterium]
MGKYFVLMLLIIIQFSCNEHEVDNKSTIGLVDKKDVILLHKQNYSLLAQQIPELAFYEKKLKQVLASDLPVMVLPKNELIDDNHALAQNIALKDKKFIRDIKHRETGEPLRCEVMNIRKALPSDLANLKTNQKCNSCYRVEMYNFFNNITTIGIIDISINAVINVNNYTGAQADVNKRLTDIAIGIVTNSSVVMQALGVKPGDELATMANVKTSLNGTKCERSKHLCVAPTIVKNNRALWCIVDLTDFTLVGIRWTELGNVRKSVVTERNLQNDFIMTHYCDIENDFGEGQWKGKHRLTGSDGLEITEVSYNGIPVINSAKIVDWHVSYSFKEGFGYSDATGCPMFSSAAVIAFNAPFTEDIVNNGNKVGFALIQDFRSPVWPAPCNYRYQNRYEFYIDGSFRIIGINLGRGCGVDGWYRPVFRIDLGPNNDEKFKFDQYVEGNWARWNSESWNLQNKKTQYTKDGYQYRFINKEGKGYYVKPGNSNFEDGGRGDFAYSYLSVDHKDKDEGSMDMITIGSCCNTDYQQGPHHFIEPPESLKEQKLIYWYVPQMKNDNREGSKYAWCDTKVKDGNSDVVVYPGTVGPMFVPIISK